MRKTNIWLCLVSCLVTFQSTVMASDDVMNRRTFYSQANGVTGALLPWVDIEAIPVGSDSDLVKFKQWLLEHEETHGRWPPKYDSEESAIELITSWQKMKELAGSIEEELMKSPDTGLLAVTYWDYGHNIDEPGAATHAYALIDELEKRFPDSALPLMARGMLLSKTGGESAEPTLRAAYKKADSNKEKGLTQLAIATRCQIGGKPHKMVMALESAMEDCPECGGKYMSGIDMMGSVIGHAPERAVSNPYKLLQSQKKIQIGSALYGFMLDLPGKWVPDKYTPYDPENPVGYLFLDAEPLAGSGLVHGIVLFSARLVDANEKTPHVYKKFFFNREGTVATKIKPLVDNAYLTDWYRLDTNQAVGKDDTISIILASGLVHPRTWSVKDHRRLAAQEGECQMPRGEPGEVGFFAAQARLDAPVEMTFIYNASRKTYNIAEQKMRQIMSSLIIQDHARSEGFVQR